MRSFIGIIALPLLLAAGTADAQVDQKSKGKAAMAAPSVLPGSADQSPEDIRVRGRQWFAQCMADWDAATHMSKKDWGRTCRRVAFERTKFLMDDRGKK
jgi:hypothetical protein